MTWVLKDEKEQESQSRKRKQSELGSGGMKEWHVQRRQGTEQAQSGFGGRWNPNFVLKSVGSHRGFGVGE